MFPSDNFVSPSRISKLSLVPESFADTQVISGNSCRISSASALQWIFFVILHNRCLSSRKSTSCGVGFKIFPYMNVPTPPTEKRGLGCSVRTPAGRSLFPLVCTPAEKNRSSFFSGYEYVHPFSSRREDRSEKIFTRIVSRSSFFSCLNDSPEHYPTAFAQIQELFTLFGL